MLTNSFIAILAILALGIIVMLVGIGILFSSKSTSNWPIAEGTIVTSEVKFETQSSGDNTEIMKCFPEVSYEYSVDEKTHTSSSVTEEAPSFDRLAVQEIVDSYQAGDKIDVFYDPKNPEIAVLETRSNNYGYFVICLGFTLTLLSLVKLILNFA